MTRPDAHVLRLVDADDAVEAARGEPEFHRGGAGLGGQAAATPGAGQAPPHLDGRQDLGQEVRHGEPRPADHGPAGPVDQRLDPEAVAVVARRHPFEESGRLLLRHAGPERVPPERLLGVDDGQLVEVARRRRGAGPVAASSASGCRAGPWMPTVSRAGARARRPARGRDPGRAVGGVELVGPEGPHGTVARPPADHLDPDLARLAVGDVGHELPGGAPEPRPVDLDGIARSQPGPTGGAAQVSHVCGAEEHRGTSTPFLPARRGWAGASLAPPYPDAMALDLPRTLSPSKVVAFTNCPLAFRFSQIEHRPEPPSPHAVKGTLVHAALEGLFWHHSPGSADAGRGAGRARPLLGGAPARRRIRGARARPRRGRRRSWPTRARWSTITSSWRIPNEARAVGIELGVETVVDGMRLRGIIDRLDVTADGSLIVVDYKTGRAPSERFERGSMGGVQTYALLCESLLGRAPAEVRLLYLRQPVAISSVPSRADHPRPAPAGRGRVVRHRAGLRRRGLPPPRRPPVQPLPLQDLLPRLRRVTRPQ